jgi:hypothetical protein
MFHVTMINKFLLVAVVCGQFAATVSISEQAPRRVQGKPIEPAAASVSMMTKTPAESNNASDALKSTVDGSNTNSDSHHAHHHEDSSNDYFNTTVHACDWDERVANQSPEEIRMTSTRRSHIDDSIFHHKNYRRSLAGESFQDFRIGYETGDYTFSSGVEARIGPEQAAKVIANAKEVMDHAVAYLEQALPKVWRPQNPAPLLMQPQCSSHKDWGHLTNYIGDEGKSICQTPVTGERVYDTGCQKIKAMPIKLLAPRKYCDGADPNKIILKSLSFSAADFQKIKFVLVSYAVADVYSSSYFLPTPKIDVASVCDASNNCKVVEMSGYNANLPTLSVTTAGSANEFYLPYYGASSLYLSITDSVPKMKITRLEAVTADSDFSGENDVYVENAFICSYAPSAKTTKSTFANGCTDISASLGDTWKLFTDNDNTPVWTGVVYLPLLYTNNYLILDFYDDDIGIDDYLGQLRFSIDSTGPKNALNLDTSKAISATMDIQSKKTSTSLGQLKFALSSTSTGSNNQVASTSIVSYFRFLKFCFVLTWALFFSSNSNLN